MTESTNNKDILIYDYSKSVPVSSENKPINYDVRTGKEVSDKDIKNMIQESQR